MSLTKKASLNALASALDYGARLVVGFIINPLLVSGLGSYGYGVWQVLGNFVGHLTPATGRPTEALKWTIANKQSSTDYEEKRRYVGSTIIVWVIFLPLIASLGALLAWIAPNSLHAPANLYLSVSLATAILAGNTILSSLVDVPRAVLQGENLGYKRMGLSAFLVCIGGGFIFLALYLQTGLVGIALATFSQTLLTGILFWQVTRMYIPWFGVAKPIPKAVRQFIGLSGWFLIWNLVMTLMRSSDVVLLGILDSAELVTVYSLTRYVPETLINAIAIIIFGITPGLGGIIGSGNFQKARLVRNEIMSFTWLIITVAGSTTLMWNQSFLQLWVGQKYDAGVIPTLLIMLTVSQFVLIRNDANIIDLTLNLRWKVIIGLLSTILSLLIAGVMVSYYKMGISGLCLGLLIGRSILTFVYPWQIGRFLGISLYSQIKSVIRPTCVTLGLFGIGLYLRNNFNVSGWLQLAIAVTVTFALMLLIAFYAGLSTEQRMRLWQRIQAVVRSHH